MPEGAGVFPFSSAGDRPPLPVNLEAEQAFLGAGLVKNSIFEDAIGQLRPEDFSDPLHGRIFTSALALIARGVKADPISLRGEFDRDPALQGLGGAKYLAQLATSVTMLAAAGDYRRIIKDMAVRRRLLAFAEDTARAAADLSGSMAATALVDEAAQQLHELGTAAEGARPLINLGEAVDIALSQVEAAFQDGRGITGVTTGLIDLDRAIGGLQPGNLIILAGRPGMGKSDLAVTIALGAARAGQTVQLFSQEMTAAELSQRAMAGPTGIAADRQRRGMVDGNDIARLVAAGQDLKALKVVIDESPSLTVALLRQRARRLQRRHGLDLVIIDHLQLMRSGDRRRRENRVQEITEITSELKALAKELQVPVLVVSQLSRAVENREDKRPQLADLRESGSIEQDADAVMFLYRTAYYLEREQPRRKPAEKPDAFGARFRQWEADVAAAQNRADLIIAKQRFGPLRTVHLHYDPVRSRFANLAQGALP